MSDRGQRAIPTSPGLPNSSLITRADKNGKGEAVVVIDGVERRVQLFLMRACFSPGGGFVQAFPRETQQAFLEAHVGAFEWFGGVFATVRYDNLSAAVKQVLKGRRRAEADRFVALRSHYLFESQFTRRGKEGAHEQGGVEGEVGRLRRNYLVPLPEVGSLAELNELLAAASSSDLACTITGRSETIGRAPAREHPLLRALPPERFDAAETASPRVDAKALVTVRQNRYSVPVRLVGLRVAARVGAREIAAQLDHYLELLRLKPGALARSLPLRQERERDRWPGCFDELWRIAERVGPSEAARQMVDVLLLARELGAAPVELAVRGALAASAHDGRAVAVLARRTPRREPPPTLTPTWTRAWRRTAARRLTWAATTSCSAVPGERPRTHPGA
jgi:hypothetical protein